MDSKPRANDSDSDDMTSDSVYEVARTNEQLMEYRYVLEIHSNFAKERFAN